MLAAGAPIAAAQAATDLPAARTVIDRFVRAIGGREAVLKYKTRREVGTFEVPSQNVSGSLEVLAGAPDRMLLRISLPGVGEIQNGFDGKVAWAINPMTGPMLLDGPVRDQTRMDADFYSELHDAKQYKTLETVERIEFEGVPAYKLRLVHLSGEDDVEYFAVDSGLLVGSVVTRASPMGSVQVTSILSDYKDFGGLRVATRLRQKLMGVEQVMTIVTVEFDTLDDAAFAPPSAIKALIK
jgi:hypothetical protein